MAPEGQARKRRVPFAERTLLCFVQALVGTKAACQTLGHLAKIAVFGAVGFAFGAHLLELALLSAAVVAGTGVGSRILGRVSEDLFVRLYKTVLTLVALRLVLWEGASLVGLH